MKKKGILFDLDGTLWEVIDSTYHSANQIAKKYDLQEVTMDAVCSAFGLNKQECAKLYFPQYDVNISTKWMNEISSINIQNLEKNGGNVYEGTEETLKQLSQKHFLFIVSNTAEKSYIEAFLKSSNLMQYFESYIAAGQFKLTKANAIKLIIEKYNIDDAVYIGDTVIDQEASINAGIKFINATYGFGKNVSADYAINKISELPDILKKINF